MNANSLRLRLLIAWAVFIFVALQIAGVGLVVLFERAITRRTITELEFDIGQLVRGLEVRADGTVTMARRGPTDPQFEVPDAGRYWQVMSGERPLLRSVSLGQHTLAVAERPLPGQEPVVAQLVAPNGKPLIAVVRGHSIAAAGDEMRRTLTLISAVNASEIREDASTFRNDLIRSLLGLACLLLVGAWVHVTIGLGPLRNVQESLAAIRLGNARRIDGAFPAEVRPLVDEANALLDAQDKAMDAARTRASDLAHGLKTPLAIMAAKSRDLRRTGLATIADDIDRQIGSMNRHVQRELARARARGRHAGAGGMIDLGLATQELVSAIQSLPRASTLLWDLQLDPDLNFPVDRADFNDILGNLVDNAQKYARGRVAVTARRASNSVQLVVEDDGPGVPRDAIELISQRGIKGDATRDGSGQGLAIVGDLVEMYDGTLSLRDSALGGLKVIVSMPWTSVRKSIGQAS